MSVVKGVPVDSTGQPIKPIKICTDDDLTTGLGGPTNPLWVTLASGAITVSGTFAPAANGATGSAVPADADYIGFQDGLGNLVGVSSAAPLPITLTNASVAVTGTFWQATQPVSGTVAATVAQLPAALDGSGFLKVHEQGTVPVTGTFWQATQPVSLTSTTITGSVAVTGPLTDTQLRASAVPVTLTSTTVTGTVAVTQSTSPWVVSNGGTFAVQAACTQTTSPWVVSGTVAVSNAFALDATLTGGTAKTQIYDGTNVIGTTLHPVKTDSSAVTQPVSGTFWQATQPVSGTFFQATQPVSIATMPSTPVTGTFWQATQPISGAVSFTAPQHTIVDSGSLTAVSPSSSTATAVAQTAVSNTSASVLSANGSRTECMVVNTGTTAIYLGLGKTPTATAYHVALAACKSANDGTGGTYTSDMWRGAINAISSSSGTIVVTELT